MKKIILASASPRRKEILVNLGVKFDVEAADFDERGFIKNALEYDPNISPEKQTEMLALEKAKTVFGGLKNQMDSVVIGVDTSVVTENVILGKPQDESDAVNMLMMLSGKTHRVISGLAIVSSDNVYSVYDVTLVKMRKFLRSEAEYYVKNEYVLDKAGAYAIQGRASLFIEGIEGCYFNVVGLPVYKLGEALRVFGIDLCCGGK